MGTPRNRAGAVIVAAGIGRRMGGRVPKQFLELCGKPILAHALEAFERCERIGAIVLVVPPGHAASSDSFAAWNLRKLTRVVPGGAERQDSVRNGLEALPGDVEWVAVHDGARPLIRTDLIEDVLRAARTSGAALPAVPVKDTVKRGEDGWVAGTLDRRGLWLVQTPQVFRRGLLEEAYRRAAREGVTVTDDAALVERAGHRVRIVMGDERNIKITSPPDLVLAESFLSGGE